MIITYKIHDENEMIIIFEAGFVENNKDNYEIIISGDPYKLCEYINLKDIKEKKDNFKKIKRN